MAVPCKALAALIFIFAVVSARPSNFNDQDSTISPDDNNLLSTNESNPKMYLIIAKALDTDAKKNREIVAVVDSQNDGNDDSDSKIEKRSVESNKDDLETAAGTNVLRPLFVYRQQLAYRERVRGAVRRSGIRPGF